MKLAIMQPYFLPYIGYFQLINAVDTFIIYDDVNFIKQGWINRNRMLADKKEYLFTLELAGASSFKQINGIEIGRGKDKLLKTIEQSYRKAPFFEKTFQLLKSIFLFDDINLAAFVANSILQVTKHLNIKTDITLSSIIKKNNSLHGQDKIIHICKLLNATTYVNAIGGKELYSKKDFQVQSIDLQFLCTNKIEYHQFNNEFIANLSILDVMMFNSINDIKSMLNNYVLQ
jgi:hypothetical protein